MLRFRNWKRRNLARIVAGRDCLTYTVCDSGIVDYKDDLDVCHNDSNMLFCDYIIVIYVSINQGGIQVSTS